MGEAGSSITDVARAWSVEEEILVIMFMGDAVFIGLLSRSQFKCGKFEEKIVK